VREAPQAARLAIFVYKLNPMQNDGWIKIHRKILKHPICKKPAYLALWVYLLLKANHEETMFIWNGQKQIIKRGQLLTGRKTLSNETGIFETTIERILAFLEKEQQIGQQKTNKFRLITIKNYEQYQQSGQQTDNRRTTNGHIQELKNDKNVNTNVLTPEQLEAKKMNIQITSVFAEFKKTNPMINFGHTGNRKAIVDLIKKFGFQEIIKLVKLTNSLQGQRFAPTITTPYQLKIKLGELKAYIQRHQSAGNKIL